MERIVKWRLVLGDDADANNEVALDTEEAGKSAALTALYGGEREGGLGNSTPRINRWLGDIRKYFPTTVVQVLQRDALERLNLQRMLLEPELLETLVPDVHLVGIILALQKTLPERTRETARAVVRKVVEELEKRLAERLRQVVRGALSRTTRNTRPKLNEIDWHKTIRVNLRNYIPERQTIIPERLRGAGRKGQALRDVILLVDESGSMAASVVYASVFAAVLASIRTIATSLVVFDTEVVDLTPMLADPVEVLFGTQLGGGTDIARALGYAETLIQRPNETVLVLISDLYEGGDEKTLLQRAARIRAAGVQFVVLLALSDEGAPAYDHEMASHFAALDIPVFACTPDRFPDLMAAALTKQPLVQS